MALKPIRIEDPGDPKLADFRHLRDADVQRRGGAFIAEGVLVIRELLRSGYPVRSLLLTDDKLTRLSPDLEGLSAEPVIYVAAPGVLEEVAGFHVHRGALASASRPPLRAPADLLACARLIVIAEGINDHENLGALFRNAAAFGAGAVLLCPRCADPLYRRSVRVSLGHVLHVPYARLQPWPVALAAVRTAGFRIIALTPDRKAMPVGDMPDEDGRVAVLVGAEGDGLSAHARAAADVEVRIPMAAPVDSLNVATAAAIALHRLTQLS